MSVGETETSTATSTTTGNATNTNNNNNGGHRHKANKHKRKHKHKNKRRESAKHHRQYEEEDDDQDYVNGYDYAASQDQKQDTNNSIKRSAEEDVYSGREGIEDEQKVLTPGDLPIFDSTNKTLPTKPNKVPKMEKEDCTPIVVDTEGMVC